MPQALNVTGIEFVTVTSQFNTKAVGEYFSLTNNPGKTITPLLSGSVRQEIGLMEARFLEHDAPLVAFRYGPLAPLEEHDVQPFLLGWMAGVRRFLLSLWFVKDNAGTLEHGFVVAPRKDGKVHVGRNFWGGVMSKADGSRGPTSFTMSEVNEARSHFLRDMAQAEKEMAKANAPNAKKAGAGAPQVSRWNTALYFIDAARVSIHPGAKIAHYCTCMEALFSSDSKELSHKLSERVACFLETEPAARRALFDRVKKIYNIRSEIVHGNTSAIAPAQEKTKEMAVLCDELVRRLFLRIVAEPDLVKRFIDGEGKTDEAYLNSLVLGA